MADIDVILRVYMHADQHAAEDALQRIVGLVASVVRPLEMTARRYWRAPDDAEVLIAAAPLVAYSEVLSRLSTVLGTGWHVERTFAIWNQAAEATFAVPGVYWASVEIPYPWPCP